MCISRRQGTAEQFTWRHFLETGSYLAEDLAQLSSEVLLLWL